MQSRSIVLVGCMWSIASLVVGCGQSDPKSATTSDTQVATKTEAKTMSSTTSVTITQASSATTPASASATITPSSPSVTTINDKGKALYVQSCHVCHDTGTLNAPRLGDKSTWEARIAQGKETLYAHALNGFTGKMGTMPPKGGSNAPDSEIKLAVDYIVEKSMGEKSR